MMVLCVADATVSAQRTKTRHLLANLVVGDPGVVSLQAPPARKDQHSASIPTRALKLKPTEQPVSAKDNAGSVKRRIVNGREDTAGH